LRYCNPFWNGSATKKIGPRKTPIFRLQLVAMATSFEESKRGPDRSYSNKYLSFGAKIAKIGPVDPEIICLHLKKKEINASKIYSPVGKFAERAK